MRRRDFSLLTIGMVTGAWVGCNDASNFVAAPQDGPKEPRKPRLIDDIYFDGDGLIVQANGDGGDTAQREGIYWFARGMRERGEELSKRRLPPFQPWRGKNDYTRVMNLLEVKENGRSTDSFIRHPRQSPHDDPAKMSRDQLLPLIAAMSFWDGSGTPDAGP